MADCTHEAVKHVCTACSAEVRLGAGHVPQQLRDEIVRPVARQLVKSQIDLSQVVTEFGRLAGKLRDLSTDAEHEAQRLNGHLQQSVDEALPEESPS